MQLANKNALITGGSSGIGQAIALAFAHEGANVIFTYNKNIEGAKSTLNKMDKYSIFKKSVQANLSDNNAVSKLFQEVSLHYDKVDILVNNAGILTRFSSFLEISPDSLDELIKVNLLSPFTLMQHVAKKMIETGCKGSIINISSVSAKITSPGLAHYEASKAAFNAITRGAANDLAPFNVRVNTIAPGLIATDMNKDQREKNPDMWNFRQNKIPLMRAGDPKDVANMAVFLASSAAEWMTGTIIPVDGGISVTSPFSTNLSH